MSFQQYNVYDGLTAVRVAATTNQSGTYFNGPTNNGVGATFTYATGALTIDGVTINVGDSVLLAAQSSAFQNGIYICTVQGQTGVSAVLQRRNDYHCREQLREGQYVSVGAGTTNAGSIFTLIEPLPADIGNPVVSGANNIHFANTSTSGGGPFLEVANNLSDVASPSTSLANIGGVPLAGGQLTGPVLADKGTGTATGGAVTINHQAGVVTTESLTTASGSAATITLTNSVITANSVLLCQIMGGTNTTPGITISAVPGAGSATISLQNSGVAAAALNGTVIFGFEVL